MTTPLTRERVEAGDFDRRQIVALLDTDDALRQTIEQRDEQIDKLATFIVTQVPGEPSQSEGAVDTAIRIIAQLQATLADREEAIESMKVLAWDGRQEALKERDAARQNAASLREALEAHMQLAAKICYAEPELSQYRTMTEQAQRALNPTASPSSPQSP